MSRILIVGASGLIGSQLVTDLRDTADVVTASLNDPAHPVDISSPDAIADLLVEVGDVDAIICTAGLSGTGKSVLARALAQHLPPPPGAILLRSYVARKNLYGAQ